MTSEARHLLLAIISDCGIALYPTSYWSSNSLEKVRSGLVASWSDLLDEALASNSPFYQLLDRMRGETHSRMHDRRIDRINLFRDMALEQHQAVYKWFIAEHRLDYLGRIPADVRGVIDHYLRCRVVIGNTTITGVMGVVQSFYDEPAIVKNHTNHRNLSWYNNGVLHRGGNKPAGTNRQRSYT